MDAKPVSADKRRDLRCADCGQARTLTYSLSTRLLPKRCLTCARKRQRERLLNGRELVCPNCGVSFWRRSSYIAARKPGRTLFCSFSCLRDGGGYSELAREQSLARQGKGNPAFIHGRRVGQNIARWTLARKGETACRNCGSRKRVQLHHVIPRAHSRAGKADLRNGLPLCLECHMGWHNHMVTIYRDVFTGEEWDYLLSVDLVDRRIEAWLDDHYPARAAA